MVVLEPDVDFLAVAGKRNFIARWGSLTLDLDRRCFRAGDVLVPASAAEFGMLQLLMYRRNVPMTKDAILTGLYGADHGRDIRQVDLFVARLRKSLAPFGLAGVVATVAGRGYAVLDDEPDAAPIYDILPFGRDVSRLAAA